MHLAAREDHPETAKGLLECQRFTEANAKNMVSNDSVQHRMIIHFVDTSMVWGNGFLTLSMQYAIKLLRCIKQNANFEFCRMLNQ